MASNINWQICCICQSTIILERLQCPKNGNYGEKGVFDIFIRLLTNAKRLRDAGVNLDKIFALPEHINAQTLFDNDAKYHSKCHLKFSDSRVERLLNIERQKREQEERKENETPKRPCHYVFDANRCFFCQKTSREPLHAVLSVAFGIHLRDMAREMNDTTMALRLDVGDLVAAQAHYHNGCLTSFHNKHRSHQRSKLSDKQLQTLLLEERVKAELIDSIKADAAEGEHIFPFADLMRLYNGRRSDLGLPTRSRGTAIKNDLLEAFKGDLEERGEGNQAKTLVFTHRLNTLVKEAVSRRKLDDDMKAIVSTAKIIREDIFNHNGFSFKGNFKKSCQNDSIPASLKTLMSMIINGTGLKDQERQETQASLSAGQILYFNVKKRASSKSTMGVIKHSLQREPPLPVFIG